MSAARRALPAWADVVLLPLINIALAFFVVGIIVALLGADPFHALKLLVVGAAGSPESIGYTLYYSTNFIFTGLAVAVAFHAGLFNIGGEGQAYLIGGFHVSYMRHGNVVLIPVRMGVGLRLGVNGGYMKITKNLNYLPF